MKLKTKAFEAIELIVVVAIIAIIIGLVVGLGGCGDNKRGTAGPAITYSTPAGIPTIWKVTIEGHDYLGFDVYEGAGGLCHAESCQCRKQ